MVATTTKRIERGFQPSVYQRDGHYQTSVRLCRENRSLFERMGSFGTLDVHAGCINSLQWSSNGEWILSGSDDHRLVVTEPYTGVVRTDFMTAHKGNIFSAKFLPGSSDRKIVSCSGDGTVLYTDLERIEETQRCLFTCHSSTTYELLTVPGDPNSFLSCGEDGTIRWFDLRTKDKCSRSNCRDDILIRCTQPVTAMSLNPTMPFYLAVGSSESCVRIFDRRNMSSNYREGLKGLVSKFVPSAIAGKRRRITCVDYRPDGEEVLVSYSSDYLYIFNPNDTTVSGKKLYVGNPCYYGGQPPNSGRKEKSPPPMKRLRLRGDWSDTGPNARPEIDRTPSPSARSGPSSGDESRPGAGAGDDNPQGNLMQRMTDALSRMLNDPSTRMAMRNLSDREAAATRIQRLHRRRRQRRGGENTEEVNTAAAPSSSEGLMSSPARSIREVTGNAGSANANNITTPGPSQGLETLSPPRRELEASGLHSEGDPTSMESGVESDIESLRVSISSMTERCIQRQGVEPMVTLRQSTQSTESDTVTVDSSNTSDGPSLEGANRPRHHERSVSPVMVRNLPGPSQVLTSHGSAAFDPDTGERRRGWGVSGPPTEPFDVTKQVGSRENLDLPDNILAEYEVEDDVLLEKSDYYRRLIRQPPTLKRFTGHRNARTMMKEAAWWGNNFILSGSDCGHLFGWDRETEQLVLLLVADRHVVNCVQPHPFEPLIATSGIDYNIKLFSPCGKAESTFDADVAKEIMDRNEVMLEETRDTITVPATLMIRMLASLNQIRRAGRLVPRAFERRSNEDGEVPSARDDSDEPQEDEA